jgi:apolipoprotein D and lipocalin family protein
VPRIILILLVLAGCAAPVPQTAFRPPAAPIYSNAAFDPGRLTGTWRQGAAFAMPGAAACGAGGVTIDASGQISGRLCLNGAQVAVQGTLRSVGPGRVQVSGADPGGIGAPWWVVWVDEGYRTLAIGTPSGAFGFVLDRTGPVPPDRLRAAEEIFDFNGYDRRLLTVLR